jgi:hypothetical protein
MMMVRTMRIMTVGKLTKMMTRTTKTKMRMAMKKKRKRKNQRSEKPRQIKTAKMLVLRTKTFLYSLELPTSSDYAIVMSRTDDLLERYCYRNIVYIAL